MSDRSREKVNECPAMSHKVSMPAKQQGVRMRDGHLTALSAKGPTRLI